MAEPFALMIDKEENVWVAEHIGPAITKFNPILEDFKRVTDFKSRIIAIWNGI